MYVCIHTYVTDAHVSPPWTEGYIALTAQGAQITPKIETMYMQHTPCVGVYHISTEVYIALTAQGAQITSKTQMAYHPLKWLQQQREPHEDLARMTFLADAFQSQLNAVCCRR
jgi:hypothetical protein